MTIWSARVTLASIGGMAASTRPIHIGVLAEEVNDVEVIYEMTAKYVAENHFKISKFVGHGCGKLRRKCGAWAENLLRKGCTALIVLHDGDGRDAEQLRDLLSAEVSHRQFDVIVVLIPVEELEAWLLVDPAALKAVFNMPRIPKVSAKPESISDPKEHLGMLVSKHSKTKYLNTAHNKKIARAINKDSLSRCPSFAQFPKFIEKAFPKSLVNS